MTEALKKSLLRELKNGSKYVFTQGEEAELCDLLGVRDYVSMIQKILGAYANLLNESISQKDLQSLLQKMDSMTASYDVIEKELKNLQDENKSMRKIIDSYNKNKLQRAKVATGEKIARKHLDENKILELKQSGVNNEQIAEFMGVSASTIWRRLKEFGGGPVEC